MNADMQYLIIFTLVAALATFLTRALPFVLLAKKGETPFMQHLSKNLPASVMMVLSVIFVFPLAQWQAPIYGLNAIVPTLLVIIVHKLFNNALLSIVLGTISYMAIAQFWVVNYIK